MRQRRRVPNGWQWYRGSGPVRMFRMSISVSIGVSVGLPMGVSIAFAVGVAIRGMAIRFCVVDSVELKCRGHTTVETSLGLVSLKRMENHMAICAAITKTVQGYSARSVSNLWKGSQFSRDLQQKQCID